MYDIANCLRTSSIFENIQIEVDDRSVKNSENHRFSVRGWKTWNAEIYRASTYFQLDSSVLRTSAFGYVQSAHDFYAAYNRNCKIFGRGAFHIEHRPRGIWFEFLFKRLKMNVARLRLDAWYMTTSTNLIMECRWPYFQALHPSGNPGFLPSHPRCRLPKMQACRAWFQIPPDSIFL